MKARHIASKATRDLWTRHEKSLGTIYWFRFLNIRMRRCFAQIGTLEEKQ